MRRNRVHTVIGNAGPKGRGVFASSKIRRSTRVTLLLGAQKWIWDIPQKVWPHTIQVDYDRYAVPRRNGVAWYLNHSCDPNCVISGNAIITARDIGAGEELTFDYSTDVDWAGFEMACRCGSRRCRKVVRAYRYLPDPLKAKYGSHAAPYILKEYGLKRQAGLRSS